MSEDNNIDKLFKDKLYSREFAFSDASWLAAEKMIKAQETRRGLLWWWGFSAGIVLLTGIIFGVSYNNIPWVEENVGIVATDVEQTEMQPVDEHLNNSPEISTVNSPPKETTEPSPLEEIDKELTKTENNIEPEEHSSTVQNDAGGAKVQLDAGTGQQQDDRQEELNPENVEPIYWEESGATSFEYLAEVPFFGFDLSSSKTVENQSPNQEDLKRTARKILEPRRFTLAPLLGAQLSHGFLNHESSRAMHSIDPVFGVKFGYIANQNASFGLDVIYQSRGSLNSDRTFHEGSQIITESPRSLHYIDIPFYIDWRLRSRHTISIGMQYSQLLFLKNEVGVAMTSGPEAPTKETRLEWGNADGFYSSDMALMTGYEFMWTDRINMVARINYGLFDVTDNNIFRSGDVKDRNLQFRLMLSYSLYRR